jgi:hypothetical protein
LLAPSNFPTVFSFQPKGFNETFAEMDMAVKNKISHRGSAFGKLRDYLEEESKNSSPPEEKRDKDKADKNVSPPEEEEKDKPTAMKLKENDDQKPKAVSHAGRTLLHGRGY